MYSLEDSLYKNDINNLLKSDSIFETTTDIFRNPLGYLSYQVAVSRTHIDLLFCSTFGIINNEIFESKKLQWPKSAKEYFTDAGKLDHPINTFNNAIFIDCKKDLSEPYQFDVLINNYNYPLLKIGKLIASDVLSKTAIFLYFVHKDSQLLNTILEHRFNGRKDLFLFQECFHSMKFFTSRGWIDDGKLFNKHDPFTIFILLSDDKKFRLRLHDTLGEEEPILMKPCEIVVVTNGVYYDTIKDISNQYTNYILMTFSVSSEFFQFSKGAGNEHRISKYKKFHQKFNLCETKILKKKDPENYFKEIIEGTMNMNKPSKREHFCLYQGQQNMINRLIKYPN